MKLLPSALNIPLEMKALSAQAKISWKVAPKLFPQCAISPENFVNDCRSPTLIKKETLCQILQSRHCIKHEGAATFGYIR